MMAPEVRHVLRPAEPPTWGASTVAYAVWVPDSEGASVGRVYRGRHTYRTTYRGMRIGYDRSHTCWRVDALRMVRGCWPTRSGAVVAILEEMS